MTTVPPADLRERLTPIVEPMVYGQQNVGYAVDQILAVLTPALAEARAAERKRCARLAIEYPGYIKGQREHGQAIAAAILALPPSAGDR